MHHLWKRLKTSVLMPVDFMRLINQWPIVTALIGLWGIWTAMNSGFWGVLAEVDRTVCERFVLQYWRVWTGHSFGTVRETLRCGFVNQGMANFILLPSGWALIKATKQGQFETAVVRITAHCLPYLDVGQDNMHVPSGSVLRGWRELKTPFRKWENNGCYPTGIPSISLWYN